MARKKSKDIPENMQNAFSSSSDVVDKANKLNMGYNQKASKKFNIGFGW